jgi:hypothetical protein
LEFEQPVKAGSILDKGGATTHLAKDPEQHGVRQSGRHHDISQPAGKRSQVRATPFKAVFTDNSDPVAWSETSAIKSQQSALDQGAKVAPRDLLELLPPLESNKWPISELLDSMKKNRA